MKFKTVLSGILISLLFFIGGSGADEPQKKVMNYLAVLDLNCGTAVNKETCTALTNVIIAEIVKIGKYKVVDRANRDKILSEAGFQQTGCVDESCTIEMGRQLGVGKIVVGSVAKIGVTYLINIQLLNVETATVEITAEEECKCDVDALIGSVRNAAKKLMGEAASPPAPQLAPTSQSQPIAVGETPPKPEEIKFIAATPEQQKLCPEGMVYIPAGEFPTCISEDPCLEVNPKYSDCLSSQAAMNIYSITAGTNQYNFNCDSIPKKIRKEGCNLATQRKIPRLDAYCMDLNEITVEQYMTCVTSGKCKEAHFNDKNCYILEKRKANKLGSYFTGPKQPVVCVDWEQAKSYCEYADKRLPTSTEWEKAARGTDGREYPWGTQPPTCDYTTANMYQCGKVTLQVGSKPRGKSPYGILDMAGNASEWTADWYSADYCTDMSAHNPTGPTLGSKRVVRGMSYASGIMTLQEVGGAEPFYSDNQTGFRCAKTPQ